MTSGYTISVRMILGFHPFGSFVYGLDEYLEGVSLECAVLALCVTL
jgi:hypothetical protein